MWPNLAYLGMHERDNINPVGITERFLSVLAEAGFDRDQPGQLAPEVGNIARPFGKTASAMLMDNAPVADLFMEG